MKYASGTSVSAEKSRAEIERLLLRYGASKFASGWDGAHASIAFEKERRRIRFLLPLPQFEQFTTSPKGQKRANGAAQAACVQETRRRWRALALVIKAKLEAVESGVSTFEDEFLAHIILPSGETVGEWLAPQLERAYETKKLPPLLASGHR